MVILKIFLHTLSIEYGDLKSICNTYIIPITRLCIIHLFKLNSKIVSHIEHHLQRKVCPRYWRLCHAVWIAILRANLVDKIRTRPAVTSSTKELLKDIRHSDRRRNTIFSILYFSYFKISLVLTSIFVIICTLSLQKHGKESSNQHDCHLIFSSIQCRTSFY